MGLRAIFTLVKETNYFSVLPWLGWALRFSGPFLGRLALIRLWAFGTVYSTLTLLPNPGLNPRWPGSLGWVQPGRRPGPRSPFRSRSRSGSRFRSPGPGSPGPRFPGPRFPGPRVPGPRSPGSRFGRNSTGGVFLHIGPETNGHHSLGLISHPYFGVPPCHFPSRTGKLSGAFYKVGSLFPFPKNQGGKTLGFGATLGVYTLLNPGGKRFWTRKISQG